MPMPRRRPNRFASGAGLSRLTHYVGALVPVGLIMHSGRLGLQAGGDSATCLGVPVRPIEGEARTAP